MSQSNYHSLLDGISKGVRSLAILIDPDKFNYQNAETFFGELPEDEFEKALTDANKYSQAPFVITPAGKNFDSFDRKFIDLIPKWGSYVNLRHRTIDPTSMYVDWKNDVAPPGLGDCLKRAGVPKIITHKAVEDCLDTLLVIRKEYEIKKPWMK